MRTGNQIALDILAKADRILADARPDQVLPEDEARTVRAAAFLRQIAPCLVAPPVAEEPPS